MLGNLVGSDWVGNLVGITVGEADGLEYVGKSVGVLVGYFSKVKNKTS